MYPTFPSNDLECPYCEGHLVWGSIATEKKHGARYFCLGKCKRFLNEDYSENKEATLAYRRRWARDLIHSPLSEAAA